MSKAFPRAAASTLSLRRISRGDVAGARATLRRGLETLPGNPDLANALNDLGP